MATIDDIIQRAQQVRDNTAIGSNTAPLVGGVMTDTAEYLRDVESGVSGNTTALASGYRIAGFIAPGNSYEAKAVENTCYVVLNNTGRSWYVPSGQSQGAQGVCYMPPASYTPSGQAPSSVTGWTAINLLEAAYEGRVVIIGYRNGAWTAHQQEAATKAFVDAINARLTTAEDAIEHLPSGGGGGSTEEQLGVGFPFELYYCNTSGIWAATVLNRQISYVMNATSLRGKTLRIIPSSTFNGGSRLCFLKSAPVASTALDFCSGETGEIISAVEYNKEVPDDCSYIVIRVTDWASGQPITNVLPQVYVEVPMDEQVESLLDIQYVRDIDIDLSNTILYWINEKNLFANDRYSYGTFIPAETYRGKTLYVEAKETSSVGARVACLASLNSTSSPSGTPDYCSATPQVILIPPATKKYITIPNDCAYLFVQTSQRVTIDGVAGAEDVSPKTIYLAVKVNEKVDMIAGGIPTNAVGDFGTLKAYTKSPFGLSSSLYAKDAAKRMMPDNVLPFVLIVGQSNADGRCTTSDAPSWLSSAGYAIEGYKMWNDSTKQFSTFSVTTNNGAGTANGSTSTSNQTYSFDAYFAHAYLAQYGGQLYALKHTIGATPIHRMPTSGTVKASWTPDIKAFPSGCRPLLAELVGKLKSAREWATANGKQLFPIAILWHQGETDADNNDFQYYKADLENVLGYLRGCFGAQTIPILSGYINEQYSASYSQINDILDTIATEDEYYKVVDMTGHFTGRTGDLVHYDESAISYMGSQMFTDYQTLNMGV